jgi:hypothetical protein
METKNREKLYLIVVGTMAVLYLLDLLVLSPLVKSWHSRSDEIVQLKKKIAEGKRLTGYGSSIHDEWDFMRANALVNNPSVAQRQMFSAFGRWVNTSSVVEGSFHPQIQEGESNFTIVDCQSDVSGSFDNMLAFFKTMNKDTTASKVDSFELTAKDDNGRQLALRLSLNGLILTETDPNDAPPTNSPPQNPNSPPEAMAANFKLISLNNIFDQSRVGPRTTDNPRPIRPPSPRPDTLTSDGTVIDPKMGVAFFEGTGVSSSKVYHLGDSVGDFKVAQITPLTVKLTNSSSSFTLAVGEGLRREANGPWKVSGYIAANPVTDTTATAPGDSSSTPAAGGSVEERLKKKREMEDQ